MKNLKIIFSGIKQPFGVIGYSTLFLLFFLLSACSSNTLTPQSPAVISDVYTAVAATVNARIIPRNLSTATQPSTVRPQLTPRSSATLMATAVKYYYYGYLNTSTPTWLDCADSSLTSNISIPAGTVFTPGKSFVKTWQFKNTGTCDWDSDFHLTFVKGNAMDGYSVSLDDAVEINHKINLSVELTAPETEGTYIGYWILVDSDGNAFGDRVYVRIVVELPTSTPTATFTATATMTPTQTATFTAVPSSTFTSSPTLTETATIIPSATFTVAPSETPTEVAATPTSTEVPVETSTPVPASTPTDPEIPVP